MARIFEIGLIGGIFLAVAAFGGTDPAYFLMVEIVLLVLGGLLMIKSISRTAEHPVFPSTIILLLLVIILLQVVPRSVFANSMHGRVSTFPFETLSHLTALAAYFSGVFHRDFGLSGAKRQQAPDLSSAGTGYRGGLLWIDSIFDRIPPDFRIHQSHEHRNGDGHLHQL